LLSGDFVLHFGVDKGLGDMISIIDETGATLEKVCGPYNLCTLCMFIHS